MHTVEINIDRINHLLSLFRLSKDEFIFRINEEAKLKNPITEKELFCSEVKVSLLKKIDKVFNKGLNYYLDPSEVKVSKEESIFFRKDTFNAELNIKGKQIVNQFDQERISISALSKLSGFDLKRQLQFYSINDNPLDVANNVRKQLYPAFNPNLKEFLRSLIGKLAEYNIIVFEFIEYHNQKEKPNVNGFYLEPNIIVLKRQQKSLRREIFTLAHELGHYLLDEEEIDEKVNEESIDYSSLNKIEKWCGDFAYYFLIGDYHKLILDIGTASAENDYQFELVENISKNTNLSTIALFTRLRINNKISKANYKLVKDDLYQKYLESLEAEERRKEMMKLEGRQQEGGAPKPIISPLFVNTLQSAYYDGIISESEFCKRLNIKADKIDNYL